MPARTNGWLDTWCGVRTGRAFYVRYGRTSYENVIKPCRALSCRYPVNCIAVQPHRHGNVTNRNGLRHPLPSITVEAPRQTARPQRPEVTPHKGPVGWHAARAGHRDPLKRRPGRRRLRGVLSWRSLPGSRARPAVATMVANQASDAARTLGLDAANRRDITQFSQQPAKTHSPTGTTRNAWKPKCSWAGTNNDPGGIAPACWLGGNFGSPHRIETGSACVSRLDSGQLNRGCHLSSDSPIEM